MAGSAFWRRRSWRTTSLLVSGTALAIVFVTTFAMAFIVLVQPATSPFLVWMGLSVIPLVVVCLVGVAGRLQQRLDLHFGRSERKQGGLFS